MNIAISIVVGYLLGCFQTSYIMSKLIMKKDIRELGTGNAGASNATMEFGKLFGLVIAIADVMKVVVSVFIIKLIFNNQIEGETLTMLIYINALFVIIGHNYPFYMGFRGGKGTASLLGMLFALDYRLGFISLVIVVLVVYISDYMVVGTVSLLVILMTYTVIFKLAPVNVFIVMIITGMSLYKHFGNIQRIRNGTEARVLGTIKKTVD